MSARPLSPRSLVPALLALGLTLLALMPQYAQAKPVLTTLHHFNGTYGATPLDKLTLGTDGNLYGVTYKGGVDYKKSGYGTVFSITPAGKFTTLHKFSQSDGSLPNGSLVEGADGAFYGTTRSGGIHTTPGDPGSGYGTVFRITTGGAFTSVHQFTSTEPDYPYSPLLLASDGSFYGTTAQGGPSDTGTVFHMTADGAFTIVYSFSSTPASLPHFPSGQIVYGTDGAIYGTTSDGGDARYGTVYRVTRGGALSVLHAFNSNDGHNPLGVTLGPDGALYGVLYSTFQPHLDGKLYRVTSAGVFTTLHAFSSTDGHGYLPFGTLTLGTDGNLYGTTTVTSGVISPDKGTVFMMTPAGQVTTLYKFHTDFDGYRPFAGVVFGPEGALYGSTYYTTPTGNGGDGTLFKLTLP